MFLLATAMAFTVQLSGLHYSGESGTAVFTQVPGGVRVVMDLEGAPTNTPQPTHVHIGTCAKNTATNVALTNLMNGKSTTFIKGATLADFRTGKLVINVHRSTDDLAHYVSCGAILSNS
jgi:hypothetical protein